LGKGEIFPTVSPGHPSIIQGPKTLVMSILLMSFEYFGEILGHEGIGVIKIAIVIMKIVMPNLIYSIDNDFRYPLLLNFFDPSCVIVVNSQLEIGYFISNIELFPQVDVLELDLSFLCALVADIGLDEVLNQLNGVFSEEVL
jgi:hypothetical protein